MKNVWKCLLLLESKNAGSCPCHVNTDIFSPFQFVAWTAGFFGLRGRAAEYKVGKFISSQVENQMAAAKIMDICLIKR